MNNIDTATNNETLRAIALEIAISQVGQSEEPKGSNSGPMVNEYLKAVGLTPGYAWCAAFVYWCYATAAKRLMINNPVLKTAGVRDCWNRSERHRKLHKQDAILHHGLIKPGDQFILFTGSNTGHTGLVERVTRIDDTNPAKGLMIHTIEGNSNNTGSREGYAVVRHKRELNNKTLRGFIQYT